MYHINWNTFMTLPPSDSSSVANRIIPRDEYCTSHVVVGSLS